MKVAKRLGGTAIGLGAFWIVVIAYVAQTYAPPNVLRLPLQSEVANTVVYVLPQGWAFFTKPPRDPALTLFGWSEADGLGANMFGGPISSPSNLFGLSHAMRAQNLEISDMAVAVPASAWVSCDRTPLEVCAEGLEAAEHTSVSLRHGSFTACGSYVLAETEPRPWAWRNLPGDYAVARRIAVLDVAC